MKTLLWVLLLSVTSTALSSIEGEWRVLDSNNSKVRFIEVDSLYYSHTQEKFVYPNGNLSHTIDQSVKLELQADGKVSGKVDFFDSRGCSFRDYEVAGVQNSKNSLTLLMTVPRYKYVRITTGQAGRPYQRPRYCWRTSSHYPYNNYRYVCGYDSGVSTRTECRLLETIQVPVSLKRI